jgi:hypothetical protein
MLQHCILWVDAVKVSTIRLSGKTVLWRCCKSVHETIAIRHVGCIQFSEISAAQVHGLTVRKNIMSTPQSTIIPLKDIESHV